MVFTGSVFSLLVLTRLALASPSSAPASLFAGRVRDKTHRRTGKLRQAQISSLRTVRRLRHRIQNRPPTHRQQRVKLLPTRQSLQLHQPQHLQTARRPTLRRKTNSTHSTALRRKNLGGADSDTRRLSPETPFSLFPIGSGTQSEPPCSQKKRRASSKARLRKSRLRSIKRANF